MPATEIRQKLQHYIETGDERLLKLIHAVAREYNEEEKEYEPEDAEIQLLEERWEKYKTGKSKGYSLKEVKNMAPKG